MHTRTLSDEDSVSVRYLIVKESLSKSRRCYVPHHTYSARLMSCGEGRNERLTFRSFVASMWTADSTCHLIYQLSLEGKL